MAEAQVRIKIADSGEEVAAEVHVDNVVVVEKAATLKALREKLLSDRFVAKIASKYYAAKGLTIEEFAWLALKLKGEIERAYIAAEDAYLKSKTLSVEEATIPEEAKVFLDKLLYIAYEYKTQLWQKGRLLKINGLETYEILAEKSAGIMVSGNESKTVSYRTILESYGLSPEEAYTIALERKPILWLYITDDGRVIVSDSNFRLGFVQGYLYKLTSKQLSEIIEKLNPIDKEKIWNLFRNKLKIEESYDELARISFFLTRGLSDDVLDFWLQPSQWEKVLEEAFPKGGADPFIYRFYRGQTLPSFRAYDSPHSLLFTPTRRGKTTMAKAVQDDEPVANATPTSLVGGIEPSSKKPVIGLLHGRDVMLQIEELETNTANETARYLLDYMALGFTRRIAGLHSFLCYGTASLVFTGNTIGGGIEKFNNSVRLLLSNPEALGSRTLFFYLPYLREANPAAFGYEFNRAWKVIKGVRSNPRLKAKLRMLWENPKVEDWLRVKMEFPDGVYDRIDDVEERGFKFLATYLRNVFTYSSRRLRALALRSILLARLPELWRGTLDLDETLGEAWEEAEYFANKMVASLGYLVKDVAFAKQAELLATFPHYVRAVVYALAKWYNNHAEAIQGEVEISLDNEEVRKHISEILDPKKWSISKIRSQLRRKIADLSENPVLQEFLTFTIKDDSIVIKIPENTRFRSLALSELETYLKITR